MIKSVLNWLQSEISHNFVLRVSSISGLVYFVFISVFAFTCYLTKCYVMQP